MANPVGMFVDDVDQSEVFQLVVVIGRPHPGIAVVVRFGRRDRFGDAAAAVRADDKTAALAQPVQLESGKEQMQQTGMIGIAGVLRVHLPVVRQHLDKAPDDLDLPAAEHTLEACQYIGAD